MSVHLKNVEERRVSQAQERQKLYTFYVHKRAIFRQIKLAYDKHNEVLRKKKAVAQKWVR